MRSSTRHAPLLRRASGVAVAVSQASRVRRSRDSTRNGHHCSLRRSILCPAARSRAATNPGRARASPIDWQALQARRAGPSQPRTRTPRHCFRGRRQGEPAGEIPELTPSASIPKRTTSSTRGRHSIRKEAKRSSTWGSRAQGLVGTTFVTFELNHDSRQWNNGLADIPRRRTGDVLVSYEAQGIVDVVLQRWDDRDDRRRDRVRDHRWRSGRLELRAERRRPGRNQRGGDRSRTAGAYGGSIPPRRFGEAALNLGRLLGDRSTTPASPSARSGCIRAHPSRACHRRTRRTSRTTSSRGRSPCGPCAASGTKFHDVNANGRRDSGEPGCPATRFGPTTTTTASVTRTSRSGSPTARAST